MRSRAFNLLVLLSVTVTASVRMDGLGRGLALFVDDPETDLWEYPQLSAEASSWLGGVGVDGYVFKLLARTPGPVSVTGAVETRWRTGRFDGYPTVGMASSFGRWDLGARVTLLGILDPTRPSPPPGDTWGWWASGQWWDVGHASIGMRRDFRGTTIDGNIDLALEKGQHWLGVRPDTFKKVGEEYTTETTPRFRVSRSGDRVQWRCLALYKNWSTTVNRYDSLGPRVRFVRSSDHMVRTSGGVTWIPGSDLLVASVLQFTVWPGEHQWTWRLLIPVGLEWSRGPVVLRLGADADVRVVATQWFSEPREPQFSNSVHFGLGLRPMPRLRLDFLPELTNVADLRGWKFSATFNF